MPKIQAQMRQIRDFMQEQEERLAIFNEMLGEKASVQGVMGSVNPIEDGVVLLANEIDLAQRLNTTTDKEGIGEHYV